MATSNDWPVILAKLAGLPVGSDEGKCANKYAGTTGKDVPAALAAKAGKTGLDLPAAMSKIAGVTRVGDLNIVGKVVSG